MSYAPKNSSKFRKLKPKNLECTESLNDTRIPIYTKTHVDQVLSSNPTSTITYAMRAILIDWLMQVSQEFGFYSVTFHRAVSILDNHLRTQDISKDRFQLLGITCLFISHKIQETEMLQCRMFQEVTNQGFTVDKIIQMEEAVYLACNWRISTPSLYNSLCEVLHEWDMYVRDTDYEYTAFNTVESGNSPMIFNMLSYLIFHHPQHTPFRLSMALLYIQVYQTQPVPSSATKQIFKMFTAQRNTPFKKLLLEIKFLRQVFGQLEEFTHKISPPGKQSYHSYVSIYSEHIRR